jgi:hypothetical protein
MAAASGSPSAFSIATLSPELRRRFTLGTFFFDLPKGEERHAVWKISESRYGVAGQRPDDDGWTGAEIKECCREAYRLRMPITESARHVVPVPFGRRADQATSTTGLGAVPERFVSGSLSVPEIQPCQTRRERLPEWRFVAP